MQASKRLRNPGRRDPHRVPAFAARIAEDIKPAGLDWIKALRAPAIRGLIEGGAFQMSLFDDRDMAAITSPDFPGERLILCRNHALAAER